MSKYWSDLTKKLEPYTPGEQPKNKEYIKLNTNENPYGPSPKVIEALKDAVNDSLKLYPDSNGDELRKIIAGYYGLKDNQVFLGNGSDEVLAFSFMAFFNPDKPILFPDITYSFYKVYANIYNISYEEVKLNEDFSVPINKLYHSEGGVVLPNPNAPTGIYLTLDKIEEILQFNKEKVVIIDEAYIDFGGNSAVELIDQYPNLLVVQTLSKSRSLAGLRVGFALGHKDLILALNHVKNSINSYPLDRLALCGAVKAIEDEEYFQETKSKIIATREKVSQELKNMAFIVVPSSTNFIFMSHPKIQANELLHSLRERGILVRHFNHTRIDNYLRITIGSQEEMNAFIHVLREIVPA